MVSIDICGVAVQTLFRHETKERDPRTLIRDSAHLITDRISDIKRIARTAIVAVAFVVLPIVVFPENAAAQGSCPSGANYLDTVTDTFVTLSSLGVNSCYFVAANGSDTNSGTSESSPWQHAPQMPNCSNVCETVQNQHNGIPPGTGLIFRGGDTWHLGNSGAPPYTGGTWNFNTPPYPLGNSSHPIYIGVDQTWYTGGSWVRPILTADNPLCNGNTLGGNCFSGTDSWNQTYYYVNTCAYQSSSNNNMIDLSALAYYIVDNFEMTGLCMSRVGQQDGDTYIRYGGVCDLGCSGGIPLILTNNYIHGASHLKFAAPNGSTGCTSSNVCINTFAFKGGVIGYPVGETIQNNVVDFSDSDPTGQGLCFGGFYNEAYNVFRYTTQCIPNPLHLFHDNLYEYFFENGHSNVLESLNDSPGANAIYNNVIRHIETAVTSGGGVGMWLSPHPGTTDYIFDNLMYDVGPLEYINVGSYGWNSGNETFFNNTFQTNPVQTIFNCEYLIGGTLTDTNNHFIDDGTPYLGPCSTKITTTPLLMSNSTATTYGYTASETFAYSPTLSSSPTVGAGTNETANLCRALSTAAQSDPTLSDAAAACKSDTTYACTYNIGNHTVSCPARTVTARPSSGAWDIGVYEFGTQQEQPPNPPTDLTAVVH